MKLTSKAFAVTFLFAFGGIGLLAISYIQEGFVGALYSGVILLFFTVLWLFVRWLFNPTNKGAE